MNASEKKINNDDNRDMDNKTAIYEHQILDTSSIGILITRISDNEILYANKAIANLLGISDVAKMIGKQGSNFYWDANEYQVLQEQFRAKGVLTNYELRARHADDSMFWILISVRYFDFQGEQALISEIVDITERKQAEAAMHAGEERFRRFADATNEGLVFHEQGKIIDANPAALAMFGLSDPTEFIGQSLLQFLAPESHEVVLKQMQLENVLPYEVHCLHKDGALFPVETSTRTYKADARIIRATSIRDITTRKQAEKALHESEERFRRFTDATLEGLVFHEQGKIVDVNPAAVAMFGFLNITELVGRNLMEFVVPEFHQMVMQQMQLESVLPYEIQCVHRDGTLFPVETSTRAYKDGERIIRATSVRNITARKQAEQALQDSEARYSAVVNQANDGVVIIQDNICRFANKNLADMLGYTTEEVTDTPFINYIAPESRALIVDRVKARLAGEDVPSLYEARLQRKDGTTVDAELSAGVIQYRGKSADVGLIRDITGRKKTEDVIRESEERFRRFTEATVEGLVFHEQGKIIDVNPAAVAIFGLINVDELIGRNLLEFIVPEFHQVVLKQMQLESVLPYEIQGIRKDGSTVSVETSTRTYQDGNRTIRASSIRDITERKQLEVDKLRETNVSDAIINSLPGIFYMFDAKGNLIRRNKNYETVAGYSVEETATRNALDAVAEEDRERVAQAIRMAFTEGKVELEVLFQTRHGEKIPYFMTAVRMAVGEDMYVVGTGLDLSARKQLEAQVQEAFERRGYQVQISTEISQEVAAATELSDLFTRVVTLTKERLGYYHTQLLRYDAAQDAVVLINGYGETGQKMLADGHRMPMGAGLIGTAAASGETVLRPTLAEDPDWHPNPFLPDTQGEIAVPIKLGEQILGVLDVQSNQAGALTEDDRLLLEGLCGQIAIAMHSAELVLSVRESELRYQQILDAITDMILVKGVKSSIVWANKAFREYYGMTNEQLRDMIDAPLVEPDYTLQYIKDDAYVFESGEVLAIPEEPVTRYDGNVRPFETFKAPIRDLNGNVVMTVGVSRDITERLKDKQATAERLEEVNRLYQSMSHEGWKTYRDTAELPAGFIYDQAGIRPVDDEVLADELFFNVPMKVLGGEVVGTLTVANDPQHPISPEDYTFLQQVSDQIALALESARLFEQTQSALAQSGKLFEASQKLAQVVDLQELVKTAVEIFNIPVLNGAELDMFSYDADGELESITVTANWWNGTGTEPGAIGSRFTKGMFSAVKLFLTSTPVFISDALNSERVDEGMLRIIKTFNIRAATFLPLFVGTHQVGVLVMHAEEPHNFTEEETRLFSGLSPLIATVLENRRQFERAQRQADREAMLNAISQKIQSATSVEAVLQIAARELGHALGAPRTIAQLSMKETK